MCHRIDLRAQYLPGELNTAADRASRSMDNHRYGLTDRGFRRLEEWFDPDADAVDAFAQTAWPRRGGYAFPPPMLIPRVLHCVCAHWVNELVLATPACVSVIWRLLHPSLPPAGEAVVITRLLKAVARSRAAPPPAPSRGRWDPQPLLDKIASRWADPLGELDLARYTLTLLALTTAWRPCSDLGRVLFAHLEFDMDSPAPPGAWHTWPPESVPDSVTLSAWRTKTSDDLVSVRVRALSSDPDLCPVRWTWRYVQRTRHKRSFDPVPADALLFLRSTDSGPASEDTLAKWVQCVLDSAGIHATAHSTRGVAATVAAEGGASLMSILRSAHWASASTFSRHYWCGDGSLVRFFRKRDGAPDAVPEGLGRVTLKRARIVDEDLTIMDAEAGATDTLRALGYPRARWRIASSCKPASSSRSHSLTFS
ncbi:hypothetical protein AMAG_17621 [Allomyces macrogynus ATCC 38327]|uniref:Tyr recombinase domain-containing protein n=1 Tax=Allomyces macrogynus (strain ATCC 38327) TaxID=578462 RepID=A0A0L0RVC5_ALLM3|nr:hypothetical protein AMAG_17621 [Allomyces macrogynus ATCC 38327]|eukprot:KNE54084.1 hypothetical protein AMAG_17621 [Allomyces macrogynus ATCC 38327]